jgi:hypothetical protein
VQTLSYPANNLIPRSRLATDNSVVPNIRLLDPAVVPDTFTRTSRSGRSTTSTHQLDVGPLHAGRQDPGLRRRRCVRSTIPS